jgi:hypothetical protein
MLQQFLDSVVLLKVPPLPHFRALWPNNAKFMPNLTQIPIAIYGPDFVLGAPLAPMHGPYRILLCVAYSVAGAHSYTLVHKILAQ